MMQKKLKGPEATRGKGAADDSARVILDYIRRQNRPYSAIEISTNLHKEVTKAQAARALRDLWHNKQIEGRTAGKQVVYHALQEASDEVTSKMIAALDESVKQAQEKLSSLQAQEKKTRLELATLSTKPLFSELRHDIDQLVHERGVAQALLPTMARKDSAHVPMEIMRAGAEEEWKCWQKHASSRARICGDLWQMCSEALLGDTARGELWVRRAPGGGAVSLSLGVFSVLGSNHRLPQESLGLEGPLLG
ncbi:putative TBP interacting domain protein [Aspergillus saccharolyticus JOP 1030-1]|uniref:TBPIP-domain-containing protein n=1 Tax=Aspergillus saccharolyticus JOP 1030-1 TaxID=1450539 RepID=A0A318Z8N3_9EURO|nr:TBPIP-domain-containing protein [Aspergillus saccharolyticus JOP 1030-1]PYH41133.1 TBPIP-domain-containing protein [Aspergillus saccharolyticus JOP 1030-1]